MPTADIEQIAGLAKCCRFSQITESIQTLLKQAQLDQIHSTIDEFVQLSKDLDQNDLVQGLSHFLRQGQFPGDRRDNFLLVPEHLPFGDVTSQLLGYSIANDSERP